MGRLRLKGCCCAAFFITGWLLNEGTERRSDYARRLKPNLPSYNGGYHYSNQFSKESRSKCAKSFVFLVTRVRLLQTAIAAI